MSESAIDEAMKELREMFPGCSIEIQFGENKKGERYVSIQTCCVGRWTTTVCEATLAAAMEAKRQTEFEYALKGKSK